MSGGPLAGAGVVVTRPTAQAASHIRAFERVGARVVALPLIQIHDRTTPWSDDERRAIADADVVVVTSENGVRCLVRGLRTHQTTLRAQARLVAVGPQTAAALTQLGHVPALVPAAGSARAIVDELDAAGDLSGVRIVLTRAQNGRPELLTGLQDRGATVTELPLYRTAPRRPLPDELTAALICPIWTFTSPSGVDAAITAVGSDMLGSKMLVSIGPSTTAQLTQAGLPVAAEAAERSADGLVNAALAAARL